MYINDDRLNDEPPEVEAKASAVFEHSREHPGAERFRGFAEIFQKLRPAHAPKALGSW
jgi:hypothetical protein